MKTLKVLKLSLCGLAIVALQGAATADDLVILHTNDTHSSIFPDSKGAGGWMQRKVMIDSVKAAEKNVILVDAGDVAQGSLYYKYFGGDVEFPLMNLMNYDIQILGNHEFDFGMKKLADVYKKVKAKKLTANYDFTGTELEGVFDPYVIKKVDGKKIGFFGLNLDPDGLILQQNVDLKFLDIIETANKTAEFLKHKKHCDLVVAVTHIGYKNANEKRPGDVAVAEASRDIDIIIGGHSHTVINPADPAHPDYLVPNAEGKPVLVVQTGKGGKYMGEIKINLDNLNKSRASDFQYQLLPVTDRFPDSALPTDMMAFIAPYKEKIDSVYNNVIAWSLESHPNGVTTGALPNFTSDFALDYGRHVADSLRAADPSFPRVDFALMNVGGIRQPMPEGAVGEGLILSMYPFSNHLMLVSMKGRDFVEAMKVAARRGGEAVSRNVRVAKLPGGNINVVVDGKLIEPDKSYTIATIDYLAQGNDDMPTLANNTLLWTDTNEVCAPIIAYLKNLTRLGLPVEPDQAPRFVEAVNLDSNKP